MAQRQELVMWKGSSCTLWTCDQSCLRRLFNIYICTTTKKTNFKPLYVLNNRLSSSPLSIHQVYRKAVGQMSQGLIRRLTVLSQYEEALVKINATAAERLTALKAKPQAAIQRDMLSICNDPFTVAQQLTHIELVRTDFHPSHSS